MLGSSSPAAARVSRSTTRQCTSAVTAASSSMSDMPSQTRFSMVPRCGAGRMSQRTSDIESMTPVVIWSPMQASNSDHSRNWNGSPAVGSCWNIRARLEA
jgi:hypothetical protein